jgi:cell division protease FtsH
MKKQVKVANLILLALVVVVLLISFSYLTRDDDQEAITYSDVVALFRDEQVDSFTVKDELLTMNLKSPYNGQSVVTYELANFSVFYYDLGDLIMEQSESGVLTSYDYPPGYETPWWLAFIPYLMIAVIIMVFWYVMMKSAGGGGAGGVMKFSKARTTSVSDAGKVTFADVAGADEEKAELEEIVDFLKDPGKFSAIGAKIPRGVLLVGPPGTGKTLLAKAVAGEAGVEFLSISGSDFVELYVGVGASRVRDLFDQAKKVAPSIIFIDEIDAVGRRRGAGLGGGHDEREQTLNQLLVEMDGFAGNEGVIVMAATNRKDILDPALLRPGRFDRQIYVGAPDARGREAILKIHSKNKPLAEDVDLRVVGNATAGFTGADLANLMNEAALLAARQSRLVITMHDIEEAMLKVIAGPEKKSRVVSQHERRLTAIHEAGHAVVMYHLPTHDPVHSITIVPRGGAGGMTISLPSEDHSFSSRNEMFEQIISLLGGRVAEQLLMEDISTGASNDIQRASEIAREMVSKYGMSEKLGAVSYGSDGEVFIGRDYEKTKPYSEKIAGDIDDEVKRLIDEAYRRCTELIDANRGKLEQVADFLLAHNTMSRPQFEAVMTDQPIPEDAPSAFFQAPPSDNAADAE